MKVTKITSQFYKITSLDKHSSNISFGTMSDKTLPFYRTWSNISVILILIIRWVSKTGENRHSMVYMLSLYISMSYVFFLLFRYLEILFKMGYIDLCWKKKGNEKM